MELTRTSLPDRRVSFSNGVGVDVKYDDEGVIKEVVVGNNPIATAANGAKSLPSTTSSVVDVTGTSVTGESAMAGVKPHRVSGRQLPPANPLVSLWGDLSLATGLKVLTVNPRASSSASSVGNNSHVNEISTASGSSSIAAPTAVSAASYLSAVHGRAGGGGPSEDAEGTYQSRRSEADSNGKLYPGGKGGWGSGAFPTPGARAFTDGTRENVAEETVLPIRGILTRTETSHFHDNLHDEVNRE